MGIEASGEALWRMDELYPQKNGDVWAVRTQLVMQLAAPPPYDLDTVDLAEYKGVRPPFDQWSHVAAVCAGLSDWLLEACLRAFAADASPAASQALTYRGMERGSTTTGREIARAGHMKHRHLTHQAFTTAAIDDILVRGRLPDWAPLIAAIRDDPFGEVAEKTRILVEKPSYAAPVFRRVIAAARAPGQELG